MHEKFAVQCYQQIKLQISSLNWPTFCQTLFAIHPLWAKKSFSSCSREKALQKCW